MTGIAQVSLTLIRIPVSRVRMKVPFPTTSMDPQPGHEESLYRRSISSPGEMDISGILGSTILVHPGSDSKSSRLTYFIVLGKNQYLRIDMNTNSRVIFHVFSPANRFVHEIN